MKLRPSLELIAAESCHFFFLSLYCAPCRFSYHIDKEQDKIAYFCSSEHSHVPWHVHTLFLCRLNVKSFMLLLFSSSSPQKNVFFFSGYSKNTFLKISVSHPICFNQICSVTCCFYLLRYFWVKIAAANDLSSKTNTQIQTLKKKERNKPTYFPFYQHCTINHMILQRSWIFTENPAGELSLTLSSSIQHMSAKCIQNRHVDATGAKKKKKRSNLAPTSWKARWSVANSRQRSQALPALCVSLCCLARSWNRRHTSWMQMSRLIWHFQ